MKETKERVIQSPSADGGLFAAANSGKGFYSFYSRVFDRPEISRRYIIKGGPGTGKSSLMREVAAYAEERGMTVESYRCSSDPDSLDGIILDRRIALLDGTAPHTVEPNLPGARDEILNLGEFWDGERLWEHRRQIEHLVTEKDGAYRKAYRYLSAAMDLNRINREMVAPCLRWEKMKRAAARLLATIPDGREFSMSAGLVSAIGMKGSVRLDTYEKQAKDLYLVEDYYDTGTAFLSVVIEEARRKRLSIQVSYQPLDPSLPDAVLLLDSGVCFVLHVGDEQSLAGRVNMKRFLEGERLGEIKPELRLNRRIYDGLIQSATDSLAEAGEHHFELERIYSSCMDFDALQKFTRSFCQKIR